MPLGTSVYKRMGVWRSETDTETIEYSSSQSETTWHHGSDNEHEHSEENREQSTADTGIVKVKSPVVITENANVSDPNQMRECNVRIK